ncbi:hypothetical protein HNP46_006746 [Pseudomonas nitritireducens]|uniref:Uncharacterized protein n=1 Tax=Pseudomonas nitroreducens TaxID=46680 RepID=A0A7W7KS23_PSENT|nr:hypothetical protein [Pseudomonas nitritireducens]MBB4867827.1 hypothetical protein [Pseudomonas nitritireducens]
MSGPHFPLVKGMLIEGKLYTGVFSGIKIKGTITNFAHNGKEIVAIVDAIWRDDKLPLGEVEIPIANLSAISTW